MVSAALLAAVLSGSTLATSLRTTKWPRSRINTSTCLTTSIQDGTTEAWCGNLAERATATSEHVAAPSSTCLITFLENGTRSPYCTPVETQAPATSQHIAAPSSTCLITFLENGTPSPYCTPVATQAAGTETIAIVTPHTSSKASIAMPTAMVTKSTTKKSSAIDTILPRTLANQDPSPSIINNMTKDNSSSPEIQILPRSAQKYPCAFMDVTTGAQDDWTPEETAEYWRNCLPCNDMPPYQYVGWEVIAVKTYFYKCLHPELSETLAKIKICGTRPADPTQPGKKQKKTRSTMLTAEERKLWYAVCENATPPISREEFDGWIGDAGSKLWDTPGHLPLDGPIPDTDP